MSIDRITPNVTRRLKIFHPQNSLSTPGPEAKTTLSLQTFEGQVRAAIINYREQINHDWSLKGLFIGHGKGKEAIDALELALAPLAKAHPIYDHNALARVKQAWHTFKASLAEGKTRTHTFKDLVHVEIVLDNKAALLPKINFFHPEPKTYAHSVKQKSLNELGSELNHQSLTRDLLARELTAWCEEDKNANESEYENKKTAAAKILDNFDMSQGWFSFPKNHLSLEGLKLTSLPHVMACFTWLSTLSLRGNNFKSLPKYLPPYLIKLDMEKNWTLDLMEVEPTDSAGGYAAAKKFLLCLPSTLKYLNLFQTACVYRNLEICQALNDLQTNGSVDEDLCIFIANGFIL